MKPSEMSGPNRGSLLGLFALAMYACQVDDRQLTGVSWIADTSGASGSSTGSTSGASNTTAHCTGERDGGTSGGTGAYSGCSGSLAAQCPDLNGNNVLDDVESQVENGTFNEGTESWELELGVGMGWNERDACGRKDSGAISVTNQFAGGLGTAAQSGASQCADVAENQIYGVMAEAQPGASSFALLGLTFYSTVDCSGTATKFYSSSSALPGEGWRHLTLSGASPENSHSVAVRLLIGADEVLPRNTYANGLFDNILFLSL